LSSTKGEDKTMIDVDQLRALIRFDQMPLEDIEQIFRALVGYPGAEAIRNATRADLTGALDAACEALIGDQNIVPAATVECVADIRAVNATPSTYDAVSGVIRDDPLPWHARLREGT
jgi:hypothetical protein